MKQQEHQPEKIPNGKKLYRVSAFAELVINTDDMFIVADSQEEAQNIAHQKLTDNKDDLQYYTEANGTWGDALCLPWETLEWEPNWGGLVEETKMSDYPDGYCISPINSTLHYQSPRERNNK